MTPVSFALPLAPAIAGAAHIAKGGVDFLRMLAAVPSPVSAPIASAPPTPSPLAELERTMADELRRRGYGDALPLEVADDGLGGIRVTSDHPDRFAIEELLNGHAMIAEQFRAVASRFVGERLRFLVSG